MEPFYSSSKMEHRKKFLKIKKIFCTSENRKCKDVKFNKMQKNFIFSLIENSIFSNREKIISRIVYISGPIINFFSVASITKLFEFVQTLKFNNRIYPFRQMKEINIINYQKKKLNRFYSSAMKM